MPAIDIIQYKRKYKNPYLRKWYHSKKGGDDTFRQVKATKIQLAAAKKYGGYFVAYKGKEYTTKEFLKKYPKYKLKKRKK